MDQQADFALTLASRVPPETPQETRRRRGPRPAPGGHSAAQCRRRSPKSGPAGSTRRRRGYRHQQRSHRGALPSLANNSDFSTDSVAVTGQAGTTNPFAGVDMEQLRQNAELDQSLSGGGQGGRGRWSRTRRRWSGAAAVLAEAEEVWWRRWWFRWRRRRPRWPGRPRRTRRRRLRQFPQFQAQPTPRRVLLDRRKLRAQRQPLPHPGAKRGAAQLRPKSIWAHLHGRSLYPSPDRARHQGCDLLQRFRSAVHLRPSANTAPCPPAQSARAIYLALPPRKVLRSPSTTRTRRASRLPTTPSRRRALRPRQRRSSITSLSPTCRVSSRTTGGWPLPSPTHPHRRPLYA